MKIIKTHNTLKAFRFPDMLIKEYQFWHLLLRFEQSTLGSLVLICKKKIKKISLLPENYFYEMKNIINDIKFI